MASARRRILNAGSGSQTARPVAGLFRQEGWEEIRLDIDPGVRPNVVGSITEMGTLFAPASFDAVWTSHTLEHLYGHEVPAALREIRRVLRADGFALIFSPDLEAVAQHLIRHGADHVAYVSPAGPITPLDMLYGHINSVAQGRYHMAHKTGFTAESLGSLLIDAGFPTVNVRRDEDRFEICALAFAEVADQDRIQSDLAASGYDLIGPSR